MKDCDMDVISKKVEKLNSIHSGSTLNLPSKNYGPFCLKILHDFIEHHSLPQDLSLPVAGVPTHIILSRIFDIMLHSMGPDKREQALKELKDYNLSIPEPLFQ